MKFDTIIIGGGLAGLVCGIRLQKAGRKCVIISAGQSALHFSSGYFDILDRTPDGRDVRKPVEAFASLEAGHPYSKIGGLAAGYILQIPFFFRECGMVLNGNPRENGYRITPTGDFRTAWMGLEDFGVLESTEQLKDRKILIANIEGYLDFNTSFIAASLEEKGSACRIINIVLEEMERLRRNPSEMRAANIARVMEKEDVAAKAAMKIRESIDNEDLVIIPAVFGLNDAGAVQKIREKIGKDVMTVATMPPSVPGIRTQMKLRAVFENAGGVFLQGDSACCPEMSGNRIKSIGTVNFGAMRLTADNYVLASGSFFSKGLNATPEKITETVFGLDVDFEEERRNWYDTDFFGKQNYISFGVRTDGKFRCIKDGKTIENLYAAGSILGGGNPLYEGSGSGIAILSAFSVADTILKAE